MGWFEPDDGEEPEPLPLKRGEFEAEIETHREETDSFRRRAAGQRPDLVEVFRKNRGIEKRQ